jgi:hypothetical protein
MSNAEIILHNKDISALLIERRKTNEIVVGVPHHAPLGNETLPCEEHKNSDENAGILGWNLASLLNCHCVIASNYFIDSNKHEDSDYFRIIKEWMPSILVEIHGHGGNSVNFDIEISSGSEKMSKWAEDLSHRLEVLLTEVPSLREYSISGRFREINLRATKSKTITSDCWLAFHVELPRSIRSSESQYLKFCKSLASALQELSVNYRRVHNGNKPAIPAS